MNMKYYVLDFEIDGAKKYMPLGCITFEQAKFTVSTLFPKERMKNIEIRCVTERVFRLYKDILAIENAIESLNHCVTTKIDPIVEDLKNLKWTIVGELIALEDDTK